MKFRIAPLISLAAATGLWCGCASKPSNPEKDAVSSGAPVTPSKPRFDFGTAELSPANGAGKEATLQITIKRGSQKPELIGLLINDRQNGGDSCYVFRNLDTSDNMLVADAGTGNIPLGQKASVANRQCELLRDGTGSTQDASSIKATFHIRFRAGFSGMKHIWVMPTDGIGNGPEMRQVGDWTVQ